MNSRTRTTTLLALSVLAAAGLALPASGRAVPRESSPGSGGAAPGSGAAAGPGASGRPDVRPANATLTTSGDGITIATKESGVRGWKMRLTGHAPASDAGRTVVVERAAGTRGAPWVIAAEAPVAHNGSFTVLWRANVSGRIGVKAAIAPPSAASARSHRSRATPDSPSTPALTVTVYRPARATLYGPGFWGRRTACGERLYRATLGVASRTLACGTRVTVLFRGQTITVPVIDRGPYARGVTWDLTVATAHSLGMTGTGTVGTITRG